MPTEIPAVSRRTPTDQWGGLAGLAFWVTLFAPAWAQSESHLVGHWKLDENRPHELVADTSGNEIHGTLSAASGDSSVAGRDGRAIRFPEGGSIRLEPAAARLSTLTDFTLSMWIQYDGGASRQLFSFSDGTLSHRIQMEVHNDCLHFGWQDGGGFTGFGTEPLTWTPGQWYHVVFVNDGELGKSVLRSNDLAWATDANRLSPADLRSPVTCVEIGSLNGAYSFHGCVDDVRLFDTALPLSERLALYDALRDTPADPGWEESRTALIEADRRARTVIQVREHFFRNVAPQLTADERERQAEWLFQAEGDDLVTRARKEIVWTGEMIQRLQARAPTRDLSDECAALRALEQQTAADTARDASGMLTLYFDVRALKRRLLFQFPEIDFSAIICVDAPYTGRSLETHGTFHQDEWVHESRFRSEMCAAHGAKLLVLEDFAHTPAPRQLAPPRDFGQPVAMLSFDLSSDGRRAVFCMKPEQERAYHLYEIGVDGDRAGFRQITSGGYSDIDPLYLPGGGYVFLSTRADVYAQCGMWARSHILTRCDSDGANIYILSPGTEPEFSPSLLDDGRILFTRWEYVDKFANRIQSLWTMRPDGTGAATFWGNQSEYPDHLGEARQIPGSARVMFSGFGHHDVWVGSIGVVDPRAGLDYPHGIWKVTQEMPWPEVGDGPVPTPGLTGQYHTSGNYAAYKCPYPLSEQLFLVSARTGAGGVQFMRSARDPDLGKFKLYLMDIYGNRELIFAGDENVLYAQPVRARKVPARLPELADMPGSERDHPTIRPGLFFSNNIFHNTPPEVREHGRYLRVVESLPKNYSVGIVHSGGKPFGADGPNTAWGAWGEQFLDGKEPTPMTDVSWGDHAIFCGPATTLTGPLGVKQVHGTVPIRADGSVCLEVPPCRMLYFQVLDEHYRAVHTMRSWVSARPGEQRGCTGCHEGHNSAPVVQPAGDALVPDPIEPPPWGVQSLSYVRHVQPIFDRVCGTCHQGDGEAVEILDLTLRPDELGERRWGGIFPEPYLTLVLGKDHHTVGGDCPAFDGKNNYVAVPNTIMTRYDTLPPLTHLSPKSLLIARAMDSERCGQHLPPEDLRMLIAWVDLWAMFRSDEEIREIEDPPSDWFPLWSYPPKTQSAPRVHTEYSQDEYTCPETRVIGGQ